MKTSFVFLAAGFEEVEALTVVDVLRRAGMDVRTVSITADSGVVGAHGIEVIADLTIRDPELSMAAEWYILPGGMPGATNLANSFPLTTLLKQHNVAGGKIAAICAAPAVVLAPLGILNGLDATCYPGFEGSCAAAGAVMRSSRVVTSATVVTANGPASALPFALEIVKNTLGDKVADDVASGMLYAPMPD
jgi:4-methyl-5(b-hydroxyethyl)-thiazole monophosphate biosynthesis